MGNDSHEPRALSRAEKVNIAFERILAWPKADERPRLFFWLGGVARSTDDESLILLELALADKISLLEARSEEPVKWIRAISYLQELDNIPETPEGALQKWREMSEVARELTLETYDRKAHAPGGPLNPRREPSPRDLHRLKLGAEALALDEPTTPREIQQQIEVLNTGITAMQSLDDLGTDVANRRAFRTIDTLFEKYHRLKAKL